MYNVSGRARTSQHIKTYNFLKVYEQTIRFIHGSIGLRANGEPSRAKHGKTRFAFGAKGTSTRPRVSHGDVPTSGARRYSEHRRWVIKPPCAPLRGNWSLSAARATSGRLRSRSDRVAMAAPPAPVCVCPAKSRAARTHTHARGPQYAGSRGLPLVGSQRRGGSGLGRGRGGRGGGEPGVDRSADQRPESKGARGVSTANT